MTASALAVALLLGACVTVRPKPPSPPAPGPVPPPVAAAAPPKPATGPLSPPAQRVADLEAADSIADRDARWVKKKAIIRRIRALADPRGADALAAYLSRQRDWKRSGERAHFQTEVAFALAELGDLRALPVLSDRLRLDPLTLYSDDSGPEAMLRRDDQERVTAARLIADLAALHPEALAQIRASAEEPVFSWVTSLPSPHANGMRALAAMQAQTPAVVDQLRAWADPPDPLPKPGAVPPFPEAWVIAESALRYTGKLRDPKAWPVLIKQLGRRPKNLDGTMRGLMQGSVAMLDMSLRAIRLGATNGLSEWGDPKAVDPLLRFIDSEKEDEQSRMSACAALAWVATPGDAPKIAKRLARLSHSPKKPDQFELRCLLDGLGERRVDGVEPALLDLLTPNMTPVVRDAAARALGRHGLDDVAQKKLEKLLPDRQLVEDAALALLLGGSRDAARRAVRAVPWVLKRNFGVFYYYSLDYFADADLADGDIYRWVDNARAVASPPSSQKVFLELLSSQLRNLVYDNRPHSLDRVEIRYRLYNAAASGPEKLRPEAVATLELLRARGTLLALAAGKAKTTPKGAPP